MGFFIEWPRMIKYPESVKLTKKGKVKNYWDLMFEY